MNYQRLYNVLIERAQNRKLVGYYEKHHIVPRCMGGSDVEENIVRLTPEEHFLVHQLLVKIYPENSKLIFAARIMTVGRNRKNKIYGWLRRRLQLALLGKRHTIETRTKIGLAQKGKRRSNEVVKKIADSNRKIGDAPTFQCSECELLFKSKQNLNKHLRNKHDLDKRKWILK